VFAVYDERRFVLDDSALSGGGILSDHSGVRPDWASSVQISFGRIHGGELVSDSETSGGLSRERYARVVLLDRFILDHSIIGGTETEEAWHVPNPEIIRERDYGGRVQLVEESLTWATEGWGTFPWGAAVESVIGGYMPPP
jgi:hypothetical protein